MIITRRIIFTARLPHQNVNALMGAKQDSAVCVDQMSGVVYF